MSNASPSPLQSRVGKISCLVAILSGVGFCQTRTADQNYVGDGKAYHNLDVYIPTKTADKYPVLIYVYGSAWMSNSGKGSSASAIGNAVLKSGYAVVQPNHRSSSDAKFPAQIQDIKAVVRWVRANAAKYKFDTSFIAISGESSGGHLTALTGTSGGVKSKTVGSATADIEGALGPNTAFSSSVHAAADWFGPTTLVKMDSCGSSMDHSGASSPEGMLLGGATQSMKDLVALANPITYVDAKDPPFFIVHGTSDQTVPLCESHFLDVALRAAGVPSKFTKVSGGGHGTGTTVEPYLGQMVTFLEEARKSGQSGLRARWRPADHIQASGFDALGRKFCQDGPIRPAQPRLAPAPVP
ncbi:MAG: alpha/beta hydrolase [Fibrobacterota bacterium]|nr:alpha/beta hydrolase [Fibrobacterota bacterium]QQS05804.1 MAG: alpha/beta hydrolase [Fibrobacterota bacterium]